MTRLFFLGCFIPVFCPFDAIAQVSSKDAPASASVQRAMVAARAHLRANRAGEAVVVLEGELLNASGNSSFVALLREAYLAYLRDMQAKKADESRIAYIQQRIKALDNANEAVAGPAPPASPGRDAPADIRPPAPPIPEPLEIVPAVSVAAPALGPTVNSPLPKSPVSASDDPFQQTPRDTVGAGNLARASEAFAAKRYAQAASLFVQADRAQERFSDAQRDEWHYCQLHAVGVQLNRTQLATAELAKLTVEVEAVSQGVSERLRPFASQLLAEIRRRNPTNAVVPATEGWQVVETASFRVHHRGDAEQADEVGRTAEAARKAMYERWSGPAAGNWTPRCEVYLHPTGPEYAKATGKIADHSGHSTVNVQANRVVSRRIDLRADEKAGLLDGSLPSEVTHVILADLFADQPLPRWAAVGIAALSESPEGVARYQRAVPKLLKEKKLFAVGPFLDRNGFPEANSVTPFYAESISLVSYLVELKGPKAFTAFLQEGPRRGYARALNSHYGFKDAAELQDKWVRHTMGGD